MQSKEKVFRIVKSKNMNKQKSFTRFDFELFQSVMLFKEYFSCIEYIVQAFYLLAFSLFEINFTEYIHRGNGVNKIFVQYFLSLSPCVETASFSKTNFKAG